MADMVIKEHYVPQRYLRYFANGNKFFVYDKEKTQKRPGNVSDYACERFFYDVDFEALKQDKLAEEPDFKFAPEIEEAMKTIDIQHIEHWFGNNVETWLFNPISKITSTYVMANPNMMDELLVLSEDDMNYISLYLATQAIRSKEFRENIKEMYEKLPLFFMRKWGKAEERKLADSIKLEIKNENYLKLLHAQYLMDENTMSDFALRFRNKIWMIGYNQTDIPFVSSDNPIVKYGHLGMSGINSRGIEIAFPISPKLILILYDLDMFDIFTRFHNHFYKLNSEEVKYYNSLQVQQSYRYVFSKENNFELAETILKENPLLRDIRRERFLMN